MSDLISRRAAIDLIDEYMEKSIELHYLPTGEGIKTLIFALSSSQPEIVRCKDCKYWQDQEEGVVEVPICARPQNRFERFPMVMIIGADGFCSFGKRREDG